MDKLPPTCLAGAGRRLWAALWERAPIPGHLQEVALNACKQADRAAECREVLKAETLVVQDSRGNAKVHPCIDAERKASLAMTAMIKEIVGKLDSTLRDAMTPEEDYFG